MKLNLYVGTGTKPETKELWRNFFSGRGCQVNWVTETNVLDSQPDILLFPGGKASQIAKAIGESQIAEIKNWVGLGGNYVGVCAGAYLASETYNWSLHISPINVSRNWERGKHDVNIKLHDVNTNVVFYNGPVLESWRDIEIISTYSSNIGDHILKETPAIFTNNYGKGKVLLFSPHLEKTEDLKEELWTFLSDFYKR